MKISVITGAYNHKQQLPKLYKSLLKTKPHQWLVCDDGSTDGTWEMIKDWADKHDWIEGYCQTKEGMRLARSLNAARRHMTGDIAFFVMGDSYLRDDTLAEIEKSYVPTSAGCGVRRDVYESGKFKAWDWRIGNEDLIGGTVKMKRRAFRYLTGNSMILNRKHYLEFPWPEEYVGYGKDDWAMFLRMEKLNIHLYMYNSVIINHIYHGDGGGENPKNVKLFMKEFEESNL